jgi:hypothetical protein
MKEKKIFIDALNTLFFTWGGDPPPEVYWAGNDFIKWYEAEYNVNIGIQFDEQNPNFNDVIEAIKKV